MPCTEGHRSQNRTLQRCETSTATTQSVNAGDWQRDSRLAWAVQHRRASQRAVLAGWMLLTLVPMPVVVWRYR